MNRSKRYLILCMLSALFFNLSLNAQTLTIRGVVRNARNKQPVADVNIYVENTNIGTNSDTEGFFRLQIPERYASERLVFMHISYDTLHIQIAKLQHNGIIFLKPRIMPGSEIRVIAGRETPHILKDLPQSITVINAENFRVQGYIDAGDLLYTEQSIQVEEAYTGKKTVSIRGGNPEDVLVLFNGIRLNNAYDNIYDFSLLNLEDIKRLEVIKGSNTALYGSEAFSGVINVVPEIHKDFTARFQQKIGTYASGDWNLQLSHNFFNRLNLSYTIKQAASRRSYDGDTAGDASTSTAVSYHNASVMYTPGKDSSDTNMTLMFLRSNQDYDNTYFKESMQALNQLLSFRYKGRLLKWPGFVFSSSYQWNNHQQQLSTKSDLIERSFHNKVLNLNFEQNIHLRQFELLFVYQFENVNLNYDNDRTYGDQARGIKSTLFTRNTHGLASILKLHVPTESSYYNSTDFDISYRFDLVNNRYHHTSFWPLTDTKTLLEQLNAADNKEWRASVFKFAATFSGGDAHHSISGFLNFGKNIKFPSMYQQISSPLILQEAPDNPTYRLKLERSRSFEIGLRSSQNKILTRNYKEVTITASYFRTYYSNKYRLFYLPGIPIAFYDIVPDAEISGIETKMLLTPRSSRVNYDLGLSRYFISDKSAFPFKSDLKIVGNMFLNIWGFNMQLHAFSENEQVGFVRDENGVYNETKLAAYANMDIHIRKNMHWKKFKLFANFSIRNVLEDKTELAGLALRDRRYYATFGIQY